MKKEIKLEMVADAMELANRASKIEGDVWISSSKGSRVNGKSILGIFDVASDGPMSIEYPDANDDFDEFLTKLEITAVGYRPNG